MQTCGSPILFRGNPHSGSGWCLVRCAPFWDQCWLTWPMHTFFFNPIVKEHDVNESWQQFFVSVFSLQQLSPDEGTHSPCAQGADDLSQSNRGHTIVCVSKPYRLWTTAGSVPSYIAGQDASVRNWQRRGLPERVRAKSVPSLYEFSVWRIHEQLKSPLWI